MTTEERTISGTVKAVRRAGTVAVAEDLEERDVIETLSEDADVVTVQHIRERDVDSMTLGDRLSSIVSLGVDQDGRTSIDVIVASPWGSMEDHVTRDVLVRSERVELAEGDDVTVRALCLDEDRELWLPESNSPICRIRRDAERTSSQGLESEPLNDRMDLTPYQGLFARLNRLAGDLVRPVRRRL